MVEHVLRGDAGINAEVLGQIAEAFAEFLFLVKNIQRAEMNLAAVGFLKRGDGAHECGLAGAIGTEEAIHAAGDGEGDVIESADAVGVSFG